MRGIEPADLNLILRAIFALPVDAEVVIAARIRHMQRLEFPSVKRVGQGFRRSYGIEDVLKSAVAFQLIDVGLASSFAVELTGAHWPMISAMLGEAVVAGSRSPLIWLTPKATGRLSKSLARHAGAGECREVRRSGSALARKRDVASPDIVLDPLSLIVATRRALARLDGLAVDEIDAALTSFSQGVR